MRGESCWLIPGVGMQRATSRRSTPTSRAPQTQQTSRWEAGDHNNGWWHASDASGGQCACHLSQLMVSTQLWSHEHKPFMFVFLTFVAPVLFGKNWLIRCHLHLYWRDFFQFVFDAVTDVIIKNNLKDCGLFWTLRVIVSSTSMQTCS